MSDCWLQLLAPWAAQARRNGFRRRDGGGDSKSDAAGDRQAAAAYAGYTDAWEGYVVQNFALYTVLLNAWAARAADAEVNDDLLTLLDVAIGLGQA